MFDPVGQLVDDAVQLFGSVGDRKNLEVRWANRQDGHRPDLSSAAHTAARALASTHVVLLLVMGLAFPSAPTGTKTHADS